MINFHFLLTFENQPGIFQFTAKMQISIFKIQIFFVFLQTCPTMATHEPFFTDKSILFKVGISKLSSQVKVALEASTAFLTSFGFLPMASESISPAFKKLLILV